MGTQDSNLADRLRQLESLTDWLVRPPAEPEAIPEHEPTVSLVPAPRRARIFLRHGEGHGEFADLTLAPRSCAVPDLTRALPRSGGGRT